MQSELCCDLDEISSEEIPSYYKAFRSCEISNYPDKTSALLNHTLGSIANRVQHIKFIKNKSEIEYVLKTECKIFNKVLFFLCWKTVKEVDSILKPIYPSMYDEEFTEDKFNNELLWLIDNQ